jgi:hypothetical protein
MTSPKLNPMIRLMPSLTDIAFVLPLIFLFSRLQGVRTMLGDGDTGWHIRIGDWMWAHGSVPKSDMFSYTRPGAPFVAWEWLWDLGASWVHHRFGLGGVVLVSMFVLCLTTALLSRLVYRRCGNGIVALLTTALATAASALHWLARPHLFTWLFIVVFLSLLERVREGRIRLLWWLPVLTILWANLHAGFLAGIVILGAYGAGELVRALLAQTPPERWGAARASLPYFAAGAGCLAVSLINPYFYHLHQHIFEYFRDPFIARYIQEFQSVNFQAPDSVYFEYLLALGFGAGIWFALKKRFVDLVLLLAWAHVALPSVRHVPIYAIVAAPVVAAAVVEWLSALSVAPVAGWVRACADLIRSAAADIEPFEQIRRSHVLGLVFLAVIALGMRSPSAGKFLRPEYDPKAYPSKALALLDDPNARIFTPDEWGDYLVYNLWPKGGKVFVDGRSDFYGHNFFDQYVSLLNDKYDWEQTLALYNVNTILLPPDAFLATTIKESKNWRVVYDDGSAIVFRPSRPLNAAGDQFSTRSLCGIGRDPSITYKSTVISGHGNKKGA